MKQGVTRRKVLAYIRKNPKAKAKEIANAVGVGISAVYNVTYQARKAHKHLIDSTHAEKIDRIKNLLNVVSNESVHRRLRIAGMNGETDNVNHPPHYKVGGIEVIDFIESKGLTYNLGNVVKYVSRADHKGNKLEDLKKAQWYLNREVSNLEKSK